MKRPIEPEVWVISSKLDGARQVSAALSAAGVPAAAHADLERVLAAAPTVVLVDPRGWEARCRQSLEALATRAEPPPAVLLLADDPAAEFCAGPVFGSLPSNAPLHDLSAAIQHAGRARAAFLPYWPTALDRIPAADAARVKTLLRRHTGIDLRPDRQPAFVAAVRTRMVARLIPRVRDYAQLLVRSRGECSEIELLNQRLTIGETYFWRYAGQFRALQETLVPLLVRATGAGERVFRVWSAGCSTGEEPYSLAIACRQALPPSWQVAVYGTDLDRNALARAQRGVYGRRALRNLPPEIGRAHLEPHGERARVRGAVREAVEFYPLNLAAPEVDGWVAAHGPFHAVFCRNVLIYFSPVAVARAVDRLAGALVPGGGLFLGASETIYPSRPDLETVRGSGSFFFRKVASGAAPDSAAAPAVPAQPAPDRAGDLYALGLARLDAEEFDGAREAFTEILQLSPDDARGHTGLALLLANQGREVEAAAQLTIAARCRPELTETYYLQALVAERAGRDGEALQYYDVVLARAPEFFMAHINRGWILERLGRSQRCRAEMRAALEILERRPPVSPWLTGGIGWEALVELVRGALAERGDEA